MADEDKIVTKAPEGCTPKPMRDWAEEQSAEVCKPCILPVAMSWYYNELSEQGLPDLAAEVESAGATEDAVVVCDTMDKIKGKVSPELRERLLDFDCQIQMYRPDPAETPAEPPAEGALP